MAIQIQGAGGSIVDAGAFAAEGLHTIAKPADYGTLGHYRVCVVTGTLAAALAASAQLYQFKWTDATRFAVINRIWVSFQTLTRFTAGTITDFGVDAFMVRSFAAGGGGTTLTLTGDNAAMRTNMGTSLAQINVSTTAALTAATTLDTQPFGQTVGGHGDQTTPATTAAMSPPISDRIIYEARVEAGEHPIVLTANEGFAIRNRTVWPAAGTGLYSFGCTWSEVAAF